MKKNKEESISIARRALCLSSLGLLGGAIVGCGAGSGAASASDSATPATSVTPGTAGSGTSSGDTVADTPTSPDTTAPTDTPAEQTDPGTVTPRVFTHPGLLHTQADFDRMALKVAAGAQPWLAGWNALIGNGRAQLGVAPRAVATVIRGGDGANFAQLYIDIARAYQLALRWKISGDTAYADLAVVFLNAWSSTLTTVSGNSDRYLAAGIYGYEFANAAEIMRGYSGWAAADFARFQNMMLTIFYPLSSEFLVKHNGSEITNYWANWDQCALACILATGVLCDREDIYNEAIAYYKNGAGNGAGMQAVTFMHPGYLGQWQESGRDQGHSTLGMALGGALCEMAWNQGDDLYGYDNNRLLAGAEYVAKSNLLDASGAFYTMPFASYVNKQGTFTAVSTASQGHIRPAWALIHNHYVNRRGLAAPYVAQQVAKVGTEGDGSNGDQLGFGTLTFSRESPAAGAAPSGLTARLRGNSVQLSWWGTSDGVSYKVKRATSSGGIYTTIASGISDLLTYTDTGVSETTLYYVVTAVSASGESAASAVATVAIAPKLVLRLAFNEATGTSAADTSGNWGASALKNGAAWTDGVDGGAMLLDGVDDYVLLPDNVQSVLSDFTLAARIYLDKATSWMRILDVGSGSRRSMYLTINSSGQLRFGIDTIQGWNTQIVDGVATATGAWAHVAVTLSGAVCTMYIDGVTVGSNTVMTLAPCDLGATNANYLGRSQYTADPYLKGRIDDLRLYSGALTASAIAALV